MAWIEVHGIERKQPITDLNGDVQHTTFQNDYYINTSSIAYVNEYIVHTPNQTKVRTFIEFKASDKEGGLCSIETSESRTQIILKIFDAEHKNADS